MSRNWAWAFEVKVTYEGPDKQGTIRTWTANERLIGIGHPGISEDEARARAHEMLSTNNWTRQYILGKYPKGATATIGRGSLYEQHLPDQYD